MFSCPNLESSDPEYQRALGVHSFVRGMHSIDEDTEARGITREQNG